MSDEWMDSVRWAYLRGIRLSALQQGFILVQAPLGDPDAELEGYLTTEWSGHDESSLYALVEQATGNAYLAAESPATQIDAETPARD
jgi:hypothetical protein